MTPIILMKRNSPADFYLQSILYSGIFITEDNGSSSSETPAPSPSTLTTITTSAAPVAPTTTSEQPQQQPTPTSSEQPATPTGGNSSNKTGDSYAPGSACTQEGLWNCVGGYSFQRCASGQWSAIMQLAPGTKCNAGETTAFSIEAAKVKRRFRSAKMRFAA
ncbi:hypothetical protein VTJ49DRAFT_4754 [Mycothermus thermophilus]|uniref:Uncharacterized protein n=1 Tax=Humicola insolens TaxID=85995 RepID=A0ABR3V500_HUMIN